jgi:hypothetical protein
MPLQELREFDLSRNAVRRAGAALAAESVFSSDDVVKPALVEELEFWTKISSRHGFTVLVTR